MGGVFCKNGRLSGNLFDGAYSKVGGGLRGLMAYCQEITTLWKPVDLRSQKESYKDLVTSLLLLFLFMINKRLSSLSFINNMEKTYQLNSPRKLIRMF